MRAWIVAVVAVAACHREDVRIAREFLAAFGTLPSAYRLTPCADPAAAARVKPLLVIAGEAAISWPAFDVPPPPALATRLAALDPSPSLAADLRCSIFAPGVARWVHSRSLPALVDALILYRGTSAVRAGDAGGWEWIAEALRFYRDPPAQLYLEFFGVEGALIQVAALKSPLPAAVQTAAAEAVMSQHTFCSGLREELYAQAAMHFAGHLVGLRSQIIDRWGPELAPLFDDMATRARPSYDVWTAYRAIDDVWGSRCESTSLVDLRAATEVALGRLEKVDHDAASLLAHIVDRIDRYNGMREALAAVLSPEGQGK